MWISVVSVSKDDVDDDDDDGDGDENGHVDGHTMDSIAYTSDVNTVSISTIVIWDPINVALFSSQVDVTTSLSDVTSMRDVGQSTNWSYWHVRSQSDK